MGLVRIEVFMKTAFTFKRWYWGAEHEAQPPHWWINFAKDKPFHLLYNELSNVAKVRYKTNGNIRVVFNSANDLAFFILRHS